MEMRRYRISTDKVRKRLDGSFIYSLDDGDVTIACRDREVAIFQKGNAVRMPLGQLKWLLDMCDEHYDNIKFAVEMYMRANRDEIGTIEYDVTNNKICTNCGCTAPEAGRGGMGN